MLKIIGIVIVLAIVVILGLALTKPDTFRVERTIHIQATPDKVFAQLDNFHNWANWSPWEKLDPAMTRTFGGPESGVGATYAWEGNSKVGSGRMEVKQADPNSKVSIKLDFLKPFEANNTAEFTLTPQGDGTDVVWAMYGPYNFMSKVMCVFVSMDKMIGKDFESGLANLKTEAEK